MPTWAKGAAVDIEGDIAAVGVPKDTGGGFVYVYERQNGQWELTGKLTSDMVEPGEEFGLKVDVSEERVIVTAAKAGRIVNGNKIEQSGMAFVFEKISGQWVQSAELIPSIVEQDDLFGIQVTASAGRIFVSKGDFDRAFDESSGGVFVFEYINDAWVQVDFIFEAEVSGAFNTLGFYPMVAQGDTLFVPNVIYESLARTFPEINVYVLTNGQWELEQKIVQPAFIPVANFGNSISINGDRLLVTALPSTIGNNVGKVFLFEPVDGVWTESETFTPDGPIERFNANFGFDVAMGVDQIFIGARNNKQGAFSVLDEGQVLVYDLIDGDWLLSQELEVGSNAEKAGNHFGSAISFNQNTLIVGAPGNDEEFGIDGGSDAAGSAYIFEYAPSIPTLPINAGLNGTWFNQQTSGQGLFLDVSPAADFSFLGWFTYDTTASSDDDLGQIGANGQRWLVGAGDIDQNNSVINYSLYYAYDGLFDDPRAVMSSSTETYGSLSIEFQSCSTAMVSYQLFEQGINGSYPINRPVAESGTLCDQLDVTTGGSSSTNDFDYSLNGAWFNPATPGQGFFIDKFKGVETAFMGWFTYDTALQSPAPVVSIGSPGQRWLVGAGSVDANNANVLNFQLYYTYGGLFDDPLDVIVIEPGTYGDLRVEFIDCANATVEYSIDGENLAGSFSMIRAVPNGADCATTAE